MTTQAPFIQAFDFTTFYIRQVPPVAAATFMQTSGVQLAQIGFDDADYSGAVLRALLQAGLPQWDAYRFLYWNQGPEQAAGAIQGIHDYSPDNAHLPGFLWFNAEEDRENGIAGPSDGPGYFHMLRLYAESKGITPTSLVKPGIYTRKDWWDRWCPGYTELADAGWGLWTAEPGQGTTPDTCQLYGGWKREQVQGVQVQEDYQSPIGDVDLSIFRSRTAVVPAPTLPPIPVSNLRAMLTQLDALIHQALEELPS